MGHINNITLESPNFSRFLPMWMRSDNCDASLAESADSLSVKTAARIAAISKWSVIDTMDEETLDIIAWELNIQWYLYDRSIDTKRSIIKNAPKISRKLGTRWAIEQVLSIYFDESALVEWFEYDGEPGHFKINVANTEVIDQQIEDFLKVLNEVKKSSQVLDSIDVKITESTMDIHYVSVAVDSGAVQSIIR